MFVYLQGYPTVAYKQLFFVDMLSNGTPSRADCHICVYIFVCLLKGLHRALSVGVLISEGPFHGCPH